jgi:hypothetical protein
MVQARPVEWSLNGRAVAATAPLISARGRAFQHFAIKGAPLVGSGT